MFHVLMVFQSSEPEVLHIAKLNKYGGDLFYDQISKSRKQPRIEFTWTDEQLKTVKLM